MKALGDFYQITLYLLPGFAIALIVILIVLVYRILKMTAKTDEILDKSKVTVDQLNLTLEEIKKPATTIGKIAGGVDVLYDYSEKSIKLLYSRLGELLEYIKNYLQINQNKAEEREDSNGKEFQ